MRLIERYRDNVSIHHRGKEAETVRLNVFLRCDWAKLTLIQITDVSKATVTRDLQDLIEKSILTKTGELKHIRYFLNITSR